MAVGPYRLIVALLVCQIVLKSHPPPLLLSLSLSLPQLIKGKTSHSEVKRKTEKKRPQVNLSVEKQ